MGSINITVPGDMKLDYKIENSETIEKIIRLIKNTGEKKRKHTVKRQEQEDVVGIWRDRFPGNVSSETIQKEIRTKTWKRY